mmetsp:Transcript_3772/g.13410  ORF Transcript_3772/g.13410 Transcript_3772/m.13410 type:complete len:261 (-) Transcript_3772:315-1097(-)
MILLFVNEEGDALLHSFALQDARKVKRRRRHLSSRHAKPSLLQRLFDFTFVVQVRSGRFTRPRKQFPNSLQNRIRQRFRRERNNQLLLTQRSQVPHHRGHAIVRIVNHNVDATHHVVLPSALFQPQRFKFRRDSWRLRSRGDALIIPRLRLANHTRRNIRSAHAGTSVRQRNRQRPSPSAGITHRHPVHVLRQPIQNLIDRLLMPLTDVQLYFVHLVGFAVNFLPSLESNFIEVIAHRSGFVTTGRLHHRRASFRRIGEH